MKPLRRRRANLVSRPDTEQTLELAGEESGGGKGAAASVDCAAPHTLGRYHLEELLVFQCNQCYTVLGDSLQLCWEEPRLDCVICLRVTSNVIISEDFMVDVDGDLTGSSYNPLYCRSCKGLLGFCLYSTLKTLGQLRDLFCLSKQHFCCYLVGSKKTVPATDLNFKLSSLKEKFTELKDGLVDIYCCVQSLTSQLEKNACVNLHNGQGTREQA